LERKYSRKVERISLDFIDSFYFRERKAPGRRGHPGKARLCVDASVQVTRR
jgi:hypothetical protein